MSKFSIILVLFYISNTVLSGPGADLRNAQDAANQNQLGSVQSDSVSNSMFNRQTEANNSKLIQANSRSSSVMSSIIKQRIADSKKKGIFLNVLNNRSC